jgi:hypothetical protein
MNIQKNRSLCAFVTLVAAASLPQLPLKADVLVYLLVDPPTTAGGGATSTRSGAGTWHLYTVDDSPANFGISTYEVKVSATSGTLTANTRSPLTNFDDGNSNFVSAGFSVLRSASGNNTSLIDFTGSQPLPPSANSSANVGVDYFPISGFGQTASSFALQYPNPRVASVSDSWGNYSLLAPYAGSSGTHNWLFLGEGTYNGAKPTISYAAMTICTNFSTTFQSALATTRVIPEPSTLGLFGLAIIGSMGFVRRRRITRPVV